MCCRYCVGEHEDTICNQKGNLKNISCTKANEKYKTKWQTNHTADNKELCESYKQLPIRAVKKYNYPYDPTTRIVQGATKVSNNNKKDNNVTNYPEPILPTTNKPPLQDQ